ncbi:MAG: lipoyl synthase [Actinomycetota bacterium]
MSTEVSLLELRFLGRVGYEEAVELQRGLVEHAKNPYVLVLEHPEVITIGRSGDPRHVLDDVTHVVHSDRGGDVTWHGPGQVVCYPIVDLGDDPGAASKHVHLLEEAVASVLRGLLSSTEGVGEIGALEGYPGVWVGIDGPNPAKIGAVGIRSVRNSSGRRRSMHGVSFNVDCDLARFSSIVPCGLERPVTSLRALGNETPLRDVAQLLGAALATALSEGREVRTASVVEGASGIEGDLSPQLKRLTQAGVALGDALSVRQRKPEWLRSMVRLGSEVSTTRSAVQAGRLVTVCEEAGCPNLSECWSEGTATFMVNGVDCTRRCGFCQVGTAKPAPLDESEPFRVAAAVVQLGLAHAVVTCVARDDLDDGGAEGIAATIRAIREASPTTSVEVLISDCKGDPSSLSRIFEERPEVLNHNLETVARLQRAVRPSAGYGRSLAVLAAAKLRGLLTKSGIMVGLGETEEEVAIALTDLAAVGVSIVTIGQYLRPTAQHLPVSRYWAPEEFETLKEVGMLAGLAHVEASPLTRSSYHAGVAASTVRQGTTLRAPVLLKETR